MWSASTPPLYVRGRSCLANPPRTQTRRAIWRLDALALALLLTRTCTGCCAARAPTGKPVEDLTAALDALDIKQARSALAGGQLQVAGVSLAADSQVFFTLGALLAANKAPL